jgi:transcriptional regulator with XRE-family HTH domain
MTVSIPEERRDWFLSLIRDAGYTQSAFAQASGVSRQTLEKIISGNGCPSDKVARKIRDTLGVPAEWWSNAPENPAEKLETKSGEIKANRHINCIGEVAIPAAFRRALEWEFGMDVTIYLDKTGKRLIIEKRED